MNNKKDISELHKQFEETISETTTESIQNITRNKIRFPYEFFNSVERGWIACDILEVDTEKELVKVCFYNPDASGWRETCTGGVFDEVVEMWRVRVRD